MNNNLPLVCVCIPVYNGEKTIGETLQSIISQDYPNFEIVVCNNMSTDNTAKIVSDMASSCPVKLTSILNPTKGSAEENWNFLLANLPTEAEFIALYHADDVYEKESLKEQVRFIEANDLKASFTLCRLIDETGKDISANRNYHSALPFSCNHPVFRFDSLIKYILRYRNFIITPSCVFKRKILSTLQPVFDHKNSRSSSDLDTWLRISKTHKVGILPKILINYRISTLQGSFVIKQGRTEPADFFAVVDRHLQDLGSTEPYRNELRYYHMMKSLDLIICGVNLLKQRKGEEAKQIIRKGLQLSNMMLFSRLKYIRTHSYALLTYFMLILNMKQICYKLALRISIK